MRIASALSKRKALLTMARPLRIEHAGALFHVTSRGDRREAIYEDSTDRLMFLDLFAKAIGRNNWVCHGYCLMTNHYHLIIETPEANLSKGMQQLNGVYAQASNRRHGRSGHLFQGRFTGILVDKDSYFLELTRYVVLNPVRAKMVDAAGDWPWSSYEATAGTIAAPGWLATDALLAQFGNRRTTACRQYRQFVADGHENDSIWSGLRQQIYLGDEAFVERAQAQVKALGDELTIPHVQRRRPVSSLESFACRGVSRDAAIVEAYACGAYSYREIADCFGLHRSTVGRIIRRHMLSRKT